MTTDPTADDMCPNCVTPWKCNGPHLTADRTAPTPAPVAAPEGGWRDDWVVRRGDGVVMHRRDGRWYSTASGISVDDWQIDEWIEDGDAFVLARPLAPREDARPEPVAAPLPTEAVKAASDAVIRSIGDDPATYTSEEREPSVEVATAALTAALQHLRLVPETDEDTVRVPLPDRCPMAVPGCDGRCRS